LMAPAPPHTPLKPDEQDFLDGLIRKHHGRPGMLLAILEAVQEKHPNHYLQAEVLEYLAARTGIPGSPDLQRGDVLRVVQPAPAG